MKKLIWKLGELLQRVPDCDSNPLFKPKLLDLIWFVVILALFFGIYKDPSQSHGFLLVMVVYLIMSSSIKGRVIKHHEKRIQELERSQNQKVEHISKGSNTSL